MDGIFEYILGIGIGAFAGFMIGLGIFFEPEHRSYEHKYGLPPEELIENDIEKCEQEIPRNIVCKPKLTLEYTRGG